MKWILGSALTGALLGAVIGGAVGGCDSGEICFVSAELIATALAATGAFLGTAAGLLIWLIRLWAQRSPQASAVTIGGLSSYAACVGLAITTVGSPRLMLVLAATPFFVCLFTSLSRGAARIR